MILMSDIPPDSYTVKEPPEAPLKTYWIFKKFRGRRRNIKLIGISEVSNKESKQHKQMMKALHSVTFDRIESLKISNAGGTSQVNDFDQIYKLYMQCHLFGFRIKVFKRLIAGLFAWIILVVLVTAMNAFLSQGHKIDSGVLEVLLGTTTVNVIGLIAIAAKWLFPNQDFSVPNIPNSKED